MLISIFVMGSTTLNAVSLINKESTESQKRIETCANRFFDKAVSGIPQNDGALTPQEAENLRKRGKVLCGKLVPGAALFLVMFTWFFYGTFIFYLSRPDVKKHFS
jgi:hypothetical protein